jgi:hypothetical protein
MCLLIPTNIAAVSELKFRHLCAFVDLMYIDVRYPWTVNLMDTYKNGFWNTAYNSGHRI